VSSDEREDWRRQAAIAAFDQTWELIDQPVRSTQDEAAMVLAAGASRYLWDGIGGEEQLAIGDWQVAHVASLLGDGDPALRFAASALARVEANGWTDWRLASALEGMARANAARGDRATRDEFAARCRAVLATVEDTDERDVITGQLATVPGLF
jgi:hypothetical protein